MKVKSTKKLKNASSNKDTKMEEMSAEDFMSQEFAGKDSDDSLSSDAEVEQVSKKSNKLLHKNEESDKDSSDELDPTNHAMSLAKLKETDPDFYNFLKENDTKLLNFNVDSDASEVEDNKESDDDDDNDETLHKPDTTLHDASDESDFEEEGVAISDKRVTISMVKSWQSALESENRNDLTTVATVVKAFHAAIRTVVSEENDEEKIFIIEGSGVFNAVIQLCVLNLQPAIKRILRLDRVNKDPQKCKKWRKMKGILKSYFTDLFKLLGGVTSTNILNVLLKHLHQMSTFLGCFPILAKALFKRLISLWSTAEETVRVLAFLCILRVTRNNQAMLLQPVLKNMYMTYVRSSKFVSPGTWSCIIFMRRSLVEMFALDLNVTYNHAFLYIRQLAIHLRNAIVLHKKENIQAVYNWQFINSLHLWAELLSLTHSKPQLHSLVYPLVMIITNTIKLISTPQYYPLRFHCLQILINLSKGTDVFVPILPFLLEVLTSYDFGRKNKKVSMKPMSFSCILRLSKSQMSENAFKDAVIDNVYAQLLETLSMYSHTISFPDIVIPCIIQMKFFLKKCPVANYNKKIRQILDKIEENIKKIDKERKKISFEINNTKLINSWETTMKNSGTPLQIYFDNWNKINILKKRKKVNKSEELLSEQLPTIKKIKRNKVETSTDSGPVELFPSDSEDDANINGLEEEPIQQVVKKHKKKKVKQPARVVEQDDDNVDDKHDILEEFNISDW